ncbi:hypothetical protein C21_04796 [Arenibacter sp. NBRC 103722]|nr:hypothetical protein C21_04796 [Arenibacter sp. NBRC 103722]
MLYIPGTYVEGQIVELKFTTFHSYRWTEIAIAFG